MKARKLVLAALLLLIAAGPLGAGSQDVDEYWLFGGGDTDSTEQVSPWISIRGANRVIIRTWSTHVAFATNDADSLFSDSLTTFTVLLSDSVVGNVRVTYYDGQSRPVAADSIVVNAAVVQDSAKSMVGVHPLPINKALRGASNGSGLITVIFPITPATIAASPLDVIGKQYMRIRCTPLRRNTVTGGNSTEGHRVNGLKGLRMRAMVYRNNK